MSFEEKFEKAQDELTEKKVYKWNYNPPIPSLMRKMGIRVRPPYYNSFAFNLIYNGIVFGIAWGILMWVTKWSDQGRSVTDAILPSCLAGLLFGLVMAVFYKGKAKKFNLTEWDKLN